MGEKFVYLFHEGNSTMKNLLGGKGANLAEMTNLGLPVPQGFTITTEACTDYYNKGKSISPEIISEVYEKLDEVEKSVGKKFGDINNPLLVSVRSGARVSMPGMMDTILNLGMNDQVVETVAKLTNNRRFAYDSYRRFIQMFSDVVMQLPKSKFERIIDDIKEQRGVVSDIELNAEDFVKMVALFKEYYKTNKGEDFPQDPKVQLTEAIAAVFRSWDNERAIIYRRMNEIPYSWGTAVNVQSMVFGNMGDTSGTGVAFSRNPSTGEKGLYGEFLINAQGEDVVAGVRTPHPISELRNILPEVYDEFVKVVNKLEMHNKDMQDMEFTVENGKLYMLQTRNGKRTAQAALKIAVDIVNEGISTKEEAIAKVDAKYLDTILHPTFNSEALSKAQCVGEGLPASPGAACGEVYFFAKDCAEAAQQGKKVILVRLETSPEDIEGMTAAEGILTARGGMTSHAAVVARGMGTCCVAGCGELKINEDEKYFTCGGVKFSEGDVISLDGSTGKIYAGEISAHDASFTPEFEVFMKWVDEIRTLGVRTNADSPRDAEVALKYGAEGIGLCRTEHMFFEEDRIFAVREMILSKNNQQRKRALDKLLPIQQKDFEGIFRVMKGLPVTIRLLDPPLHEFLPSADEDISNLAKEMGVSFETLSSVVSQLHEFNPMLGHRGCRLAITYPEIAEMQAKAIMQAAVAVMRENISVKPEIMIPLVGEVKELTYVKKTVVAAVEEVLKSAGVDIKYKVGTMIEIPRACITADKIAEEAEFFSFGTNDLTQMTFGFSRDDAGKFLGEYYDRKIFETDPFGSLDQDGVGYLVEMAVRKGKSTRPGIKLGICGEHGGDPSSIEFCHRAGLDYVSCSPYRVPIARLAAAQAAIKSR